MQRLVISAGDSADGDRGSFHLHRFAITIEGGIRLAATERVPV
jgi:hypothetical protein